MFVILIAMLFVTKIDLCFPKRGCRRRRANHFQEVQGKKRVEAGESGDGRR